MLVLGKLPVLGRPLIIVGQGPTALAVSAGGAIWTFFSLSSVIPYGTFRQYFSLLESFSDHPPCQRQTDSGQTITTNHKRNNTLGGGRVVRWSMVNFQCRGVLQFGL